MDFDKILEGAGDALAAVAPTIASAFGGPLAGLAVTQVEKWIGVAPGAAKADAAGFAAKLQDAFANPEQVLALKKLDAEFKQFCMENDLQLFKAEIEDKASARTLQATTRSWTQPVLAWFFVVSTVALVMIVLYGIYEMMTGTGGVKGALINNIELALAAANLVGIIIGKAMSWVDQVSGYYFGSSHGSAAKTDALTASVQSFAGTALKR